jgi:hypothetical protein
MIQRFFDEFLSGISRDRFSYSEPYSISPPSSSQQSAPALVKTSASHIHQWRKRKREVQMNLDGGTAYYAVPIRIEGLSYSLQ